MAGPTVSVALREPLGDLQMDELGAWLRAIGDVERGAQPRRGLLGIATWDLRVTDLAAIGMEQPPAYGRGDSCPLASVSATALPWASVSCQ